jgi:hypothetical protein
VDGWDGIEGPSMAEQSSDASDESQSESRESYLVRNGIEITLVQVNDVVVSCRMKFYDAVRFLTHLRETGWEVKKDG